MSVASSVACHYHQNYRGKIARCDGILLKISGVAFTAVELATSDQSLWKHLLTLGLLVYSAAVFFFYLRDAWYDPQTSEFRPYSWGKLALHISMHCAGAGVSILLFAARQGLPW